MIKTYGFANPGLLYGVVGTTSTGPFDVLSAYRNVCFLRAVTALLPVLGATRHLNYGSRLRVRWSNMRMFYSR